ncbi:MAG TPA: hypothetical protein VJ375_10345 [Gaiellaceae bacterium]|nr:hypothetical protein [Gaiellaceae bacterium]
MSERRLRPLLVAALLLGAATAAAVALNLLLLGRASAGNDPVGQLRPRIASVPAQPVTPAVTVLPTHGRIDNEGADD